jgi:hypothetical protein
LQRRTVEQPLKLGARKAVPLLHIEDKRLQPVGVEGFVVSGVCDAMKQ